MGLKVSRAGVLTGPCLILPRRKLNLQEGSLTIASWGQNPDLLTALGASQDQRLEKSIFPESLTYTAEASSLLCWIQVPPLYHVPLLNLVTFLQQCCPQHLFFQGASWMLARMRRFGFQFCHSLAERPWTSRLSSLDLVLVH